MASEKKEKTRQILDACYNRDVDSLRHLAASDGGLLEDEIRRTAWPLLLGCEPNGHDEASNSNDLSPHRDEDQVQLDVDRSFVYYPEDKSESKKDARRHELSRVIVTVLRCHPMLHYFQGYHDIVQVLLLVLGTDAAVPAVSRLSLLRIRDFMLPTMSGTQAHLQLLPEILHAADSGLYKHLSQTQPFFALSATLTLYAHDIEEYGDIARLFDFLLASEAVVSIYLFTAVIISRKNELLEIEAEEPEMLHSILSKLPKPLDLEYLIRRTIELYQQHPPEKLPGRIWAHVSSSSVLKTTHDFHKLSQQSLQDGERWFDREATAIRRRDDLQAKKQRLKAIALRYRRPAAWTSAAVLVAIFAIYSRNTGLPPSIFRFGAALLGRR